MSELCLRNCVFNPRKKSKKWARNSKMREKSAQKAGISAWESQFLPVKRRKLSQESDSRPLLPLSQKKMHYPSFPPSHKHTHTHTHTHTLTLTQKQTIQNYHCAEANYSERSEGIGRALLGTMDSSEADCERKKVHHPPNQPPTQKNIHVYIRVSPHFFETTNICKWISL